MKDNYFVSIHSSLILSFYVQQSLYRLQVCKDIIKMNAIIMSSASGTTGERQLKSKKTIPI